MAAGAPGTLAPSAGPACRGRRRGGRGAAAAPARPPASHWAARPAPTGAAGRAGPACLPPASAGAHRVPSSLPTARPPTHQAGQARLGCAQKRDAPAGYPSQPAAPHLSRWGSFPRRRARTQAAARGCAEAAELPCSVHGATPLTSGFLRSRCPAPDIISPGGLPAPRR